MEKAGNVAGPLLGYEVLTAFFLEASFLGIMLFGKDRVSNRTHLFASALVAIGTTFELERRAVGLAAERSDPRPARKHAEEGPKSGSRSQCK
jgi:hypothetical protein